jgi:hypothetical protein
LLYIQHCTPRFPWPSINPHDRPHLYVLNETRYKKRFRWHARITGHFQGTSMILGFFGA